MSDKDVSHINRAIAFSIVALSFLVVFFMLKDRVDIVIAILALISSLTVSMIGLVRKRIMAIDLIRENNILFLSIKNIVEMRIYDFEMALKEDNLFKYLTNEDLKNLKDMRLTYEFSAKHFGKKNIVSLSLDKFIYH